MSSEPAQPATLREHQTLFARLLAKLITYAFDQGYEITMGEVSVEESRRSRSGTTFADGMHMPKSLHYHRLAADLNLFVAGDYVADGSHPAWADLGAYWRSLHELAAWGGDFASRDSNHFSLRYGGRA